MKVILLLLVCCLSLVCGRQESQLSTLLSQVYNSETNTLSFSNVSISGVGNAIFQNVFSSDREISFAGATCNVVKDDHISCLAAKNISSTRTQVQIIIKKKEDEQQKYALAMNIQFHNSKFNDLQQQIVVPPLLKSIGSLDFSLTIASEAFSADGKEYSKGVLIDSQNVNIDLFDESLATLITDEQKRFKYKLQVFVPFQANSTSIDAKATKATIFVASSLAFNNGGQLRIDGLRINVDGLSSKTNLKFESKVFVSIPAPQSEKKELEFDMEGSYDGVAKVLKFDGEVVGKFTRPFTHANWWSFEGTKANFVLNLSKAVPELQSFDFSGISSIYLGTTTRIQPRLIGRLTENAKTFFFELTIEHQQRKSTDLLYSVLETTMEKKSSDIARDVVSQSSISLIFTNVNNSKSSTGNSCAQGLNIFATVLVAQNSKLEKGLQPLNTQKKLSAMKFVLAVQFINTSPVFNFATSSFKASLSADSVVFNSYLKLESLNIALNFEKKVLDKLTANGLIIWTPKGENTISFKATAEWTHADSIAKFSGGLHGSVKGNLGGKWLSIVDAKLNMEISFSGSPVLTKFGVSADAKLTWSKNKDQTYKLNLIAIDNFSGVFFFVKAVIRNDGGSSLLKSIVNPKQSGNSALSSLRLKNIDVKLTFSTSLYRFEGQYYKRGISLSASVVVQQNSPLRKQLAPLYHKVSSDLEFVLRMTVAFEDMVEVRFSLTTPRIFLKDNIIMENTELAVTAGAIFKVSVSSGVSIKFDSQPDFILFAISGEITSASQLIIGGGMKGTWRNAVGIRGFHIHKSYLQLGFIAVPPYLQSFGVGGNTTIGRTSIAVDGYVNLLNPTDIFFKTQIDNLALKYLIQSLGENDQIDIEDKKAFRKLLESLESNNRIIAHDSRSLALVGDGNNGTRSLSSKRKPILLIKDLDINFSPKDKLIKIGAIETAFKKGISIYGHVVIFGLKNSRFYLHSVKTNGKRNFIAEFDLNFTTVYQKWMGFMKVLFPNKEFQGHMHLRKLSAADIHDFIKSLSNNIPQLTSLKIGKVDIHGLLSGRVKPTISGTVLFRKKTYTFGSEVTFEQLSNPLSTIFEGGLISWRKLLGLPECLTNIACKKKGMKCFNVNGHKDDNTCVKSCGSYGEVPIFGCTKCLTSSECTKSGVGSCCVNGQCTKPRNGKFCGMCGFGRKCSSPHSGCILTFCTKCITSLDCLWSGSAGKRCKRGKCVPWWR